MMFIVFVVLLSVLVYFQNENAANCEKTPEYERFMSLSKIILAYYPIAFAVIAGLLFFDFVSKRFFGGIGSLITSSITSIFSLVYIGYYLINREKINVSLCNQQWIVGYTDSLLGIITGGQILPWLGTVAMFFFKMYF